MVLTKHEIEDEVLIDRLVEPDPNTGDPAEWRVKERGVPIWALIGGLEPDGGNADEVARDYGISREAMTAARAYYRRHQASIDARLLANRTA